MAKPSQLAILVERRASKVIFEQTPIMFQMALDCACIAAHDVLGMGPGRAAEFVRQFNENINQYADIIGKNITEDSDMWVAQEHLDRVLRPIFKEEDFAPFLERYGEMRLDAYKRLRRKK